MRQSYRVDIIESDGRTRFGDVLEADSMADAAAKFAVQCLRHGARAMVRISFLSSKTFEVTVKKSPTRGETKTQLKEVNGKAVRKTRSR